MADKNMNTVLVVIGVLVVAYLFLGKGNNQPYTPPLADQQCAITPSLAATGVDALVSNTALTAGNYSYIVNGVFKGSSADLVRGQTVQLLSNPGAAAGTAASGVLSEVQTFTVGCDKNAVDFKYYQYSNPTISIKQDPTTGSSVLGDATCAVGGSVNDTHIASGSTKSFDITVTGTSQKSTGKIFAVVETPASSSSNVSKIELTGCGASPANIPSYVSSSNANSMRAGFEIPAQVGSGNKVCTLQITTVSGKTLYGSIETTFYAEEKFVDTDGVVKEGIYDADGNIKYQSTYDYDFCLVG